MKSNPLRFGGIRLCVALGLPLWVAGCAGSNGGGQPPTRTQLQQQSNTIMNDPHVPDSIKQHLSAQQEASRAAARGYTADLQQKQAGNR